MQREGGSGPRNLAGNRARVSLLSGPGDAVAVLMAQVRVTAWELSWSRGTPVTSLWPSRADSLLCLYPEIKNALDIRNDLFSLGLEV